MRNYKYLIIGNSAGGVGTVEAIRSIDKDGSMAVISDEDHHTYSRPLISYYLAGEIAYDKVFYRPMDFYDKKNIDAILGKKAIKIDFDERLVYLDNGEPIGYGKLLLATGGEPFVPKISGMEDHEFLTFTTLNDSMQINERLEDGGIRKAVVVGGGLIGLKASEGLIGRGVRVTVVELAERILGPVLDDQASGMIKEVLEEKGLEIITGHTITEIFGENGKADGVILDNNEKIYCDLVVIAIGVRPRIELVKGTQVNIGRGIIVDKRMETNVPGVYACGDCAEVYDFIMDSFRLTPLWPTAHVGGRIAGSNMAGVEKEYVWGTGMNSVDFFGFPVISAGLVNPSEGEEMETLIKLEPDKKIYKKFLIRDQNIVGMILVNEVDRAGVILGLMRDKVDVESFKDKLLLDDFGRIYLPKELRKEPSLAGV